MVDVVCPLGCQVYVEPLLTAAERVEQAPTQTDTGEAETVADGDVLHDSFKETSSTYI